MRSLALSGGLLALEAGATAVSFAEYLSQGAVGAMALGVIGLLPAIDRCAAALFAKLTGAA